MVLCKPQCSRSLKCTADSKFERAKFKYQNLNSSFKEIWLNERVADKKPPRDDPTSRFEDIKYLGRKKFSTIHVNEESYEKIRAGKKGWIFPRFFAFSLTN